MRLALLLAGSLAPARLFAQALPAADSVPSAPLPHPLPLPHRPWYRGALVRGSLVPAALIAYGASTINGNGLYSSYQAKKAIRRTFGPYRTRADDFLQYAPYLELGGVLLAGVQTRDDRLHLALLVAKSEALMVAAVYATKYLTQVQRPDSSTHHSFPSGHTAQAFLAASIVHKELRDKSQWYGVGAYALATSVGVLRMVNNKHWQADVLAGAGFGIWSAHLAHLSQQPRTARRPRKPAATGAWRITPAWTTGAVGLRLDWHPR